MKDGHDLGYGYRIGDGLLDVGGGCVPPWTEVIDLFVGVPHGKVEEALIALVETPDGHWCKGAEISVGDESMGYWPSINNTAFETKKEAIQAAWKEMVRYVNQHPHAEQIIANYESVIAECDQLSLF